MSARIDNEVLMLLDSLHQKQIVQAAMNDSCRAEFETDAPQTAKEILQPRKFTLRVF